MRLKLILVSCVGQKLEGSHQAKDLYISNWFKKARIYAEQNGDSWAIISAKYGFVFPDDEIESYEMYLPKQSKEYRLEWAKIIVERINTISPTEIEILAGKPYRQYLIPLLQYKVVVPMEGLGIGQQLKWLKEMID